MKLVSGQDFNLMMLMIRLRIKGPSAGYSSLFDNVIQYARDKFHIMNAEDSDIFRRMSKEKQKAYYNALASAETNPRNFFVHMQEITAMDKYTLDYFSIRPELKWEYISLLHAYHGYPVPNVEMLEHGIPNREKMEEMLLRMNRLMMYRIGMEDQDADFWNSITDGDIDLATLIASSDIHLDLLFDALKQVAVKLYQIENVEEYDLFRNMAPESQLEYDRELKRDHISSKLQTMVKKWSHGLLEVNDNATKQQLYARFKQYLHYPVPNRRSLQRNLKKTERTVREIALTLNRIIMYRTIEDEDSQFWDVVCNGNNEIKKHILSDPTNLDVLFNTIRQLVHGDAKYVNELDKFRTSSTGEKMEYLELLNSTSGMYDYECERMIKKLSNDMLRRNISYRQLKLQLLRYLPTQETRRIKIRSQVNDRNTVFSPLHQRRGGGRGRGRGLTRRRRRRYTAAD